MNDIRIHSIEGSMLASVAGCRKLLSLRKACKETTQVFVIAPMNDGSPLELDSLLRSALNHDERMWSAMEKSSEIWGAFVDALLPRTHGEEVHEAIKQGFSDIEDVLRTIWLVGDVSEGSRRFIDSTVVSWLALAVGRFLEDSGSSVTIVDISKALSIQDASSFGAQTVLVIGDLPQSEGVAQADPAVHLRHEGGSEYAASLLAVRLNAKALTLWNNRSLLRTADIKMVPGAKVIETLTYAESTELSFFGAPIIHPQAMLPAVSAAIPIKLRWWGDIKAPGTLVVAKPEKDVQYKVKGFSIIHDIALINVEGAGMSGVPGISSRLFTSMREAGISVILISQASSEYSICFAVPDFQAALACRTTRNEFSRELDEQLIHSVESEHGCAILAAVGEMMPGTPGVAGKFFSSLGKAGVNVRAIAQGSSERNISAVIKDADGKRALRALHAGFFLSRQALSVGLFGPGNIGGTLLDQIARETDRLHEQFDVDIRIRAIANSRRMLLDEDGIDLTDWRDKFEREAVELDLEALVSHVGATYYPHSVLIDCTTSSQLPERYVSWLEKGIHIVTPNKKAGTSPYPYYRMMMDTCRRTGKRFLYETTVGAGLPVIGTLKDLIQTGDRIHKIEGIVSGTLAWLFSNYDGSVPFSAMVRQAKAMGYTEPDPRDDLSGMDVARKTVILARELGYQVEVSQLSVTSLVPKVLEGLPVGEFLARLEEADEAMLRMYREAESRGEKLRYVGMVDTDGTCSVSLKGYPSDHPFAQASGTDNIIAFTTDRYLTQPLVIKGPGAGPEVTAGGVFADVLRLSAYLGARI